MSIDHPNTSSLSNRPADASRPVEGERPAERPRDAPPKEEVDRFRQLMQHGRHEGRRGPDGKLKADTPQQGPAGSLRHAGQAQGHETAQAVHAPEGRGHEEGQGEHQSLAGSAIEGTELLAMMQAQAALRDMAGATVAPAPPQTASGKALAEMLERHVRQFAVGGAAAEHGDGQVLLRMSDATLPGTDLLLSRTGDGWHLRADVRSRASYDAIREAAPALARRFAEQNLGTLEIDPHFDA